MIRSWSNETLYVMSRGKGVFKPNEKVKCIGVIVVDDSLLSTEKVPKGILPFRSTSKSK